jgi:hypothetical protein
MLALLVVGAATLLMGLRFRRFAFVAYGVIYPYVGISDLILNHTHGEAAFFAYFAVSAALVIVFLVVAARRFGQEP